jgi:hypothetical protein
MCQNIRAGFGVAELARVQTTTMRLNSGEFSYRQESLPHPMSVAGRRLGGQKKNNCL